ncbi:MAG: isoprenylcysteine carboxylmethyltransferase family protein [SAR324 cluster bacterium]|nr:isoprenylcysteine carboxylmethyltransferase family protein [SAR324 cluster bacterium]
MSYQYPILIALMIQRLWELYVSRKRLAEDVEHQSARLLAEPKFPAMVAVHVGWFAGCWLEVLSARPPFVDWLVIPMLAVWGGSVALRLWMMLALGRLWNVRLIERDEQPVVVSGPYRFIRHPNYRAVIAEITAVPLLLGAYWTALAATLANAAVLWFRIRDEEAYLFSVDEYAEAFTDKKRLIPRLF